MPGFSTLVKLLLVAICVHGSSGSDDKQAKSDFKVVILGGGVAGIIAARTLHEQGIDDFVIIEARDELGGRLRSASFGGKTVEFGANWIQGTQTGDGSANPIYTLAKKHKVKAQYNDLFGSITTYDQTGAVDFWTPLIPPMKPMLNLLRRLVRSRIPNKLVDISSRSAYTLVGAKPLDAHAKAAEYFLFDWEYAQTPDQSSAIASSWNNNFTFDTDYGGFSEDNLLNIDQRGFKTFIQEEAKEFLTPGQVRVGSVVKTIAWSGAGVKVILGDGTLISGDYALCTFSVGVLQNDDVEFEPSLPAYKQEAISSITMATYTKIFLQFPEKFWFDTEERSLFLIFAKPAY
ncbi:Polyamine oxidase [Hypsizygus marmoreus]|uniref:Polyamine oxidase n=1 Tax=Hypsizygus marmoreus TaxID=39966 RepID=A0A369JGT6_HYPMA|nr:Polyamine oxidase [Hypsizygus marmoreus]